MSATEHPPMKPGDRVRILAIEGFDGQPGRHGEFPHHAAGKLATIEDLTTNTVALVIDGETRLSYAYKAELEVLS